MRYGSMPVLVALLIPTSVCLAATPSSPPSAPSPLAASVTALQSWSPAAQQAARQQLIRLGESKTAPATYPASLAEALLPVLQSGTTRAKLNAAVALERVAAKTPSPALAPAASALLADKAEAVTLWGIKTARHLIAEGGSSAGTLAAQVAAAVKAHPDSGPIAEEAYAALLPELAPQPAVLQSLLETLESRTALYFKGAIPPSPSAEQAVPAYLAVTCWSHLNVADQKRVLTDLGNLCWSSATAVANGNNDSSVQKIAQITAVGLEAIATRLVDAPLAAAAHALTDLGPANAVPIPARCKALVTALSLRGVTVVTIP
jgi:hypothetical protein